MKTKNILLWIAISIFIIGILLLNLKQPSFFKENTNAFILIASSIVMLFSLLLVRKQKLTIKKRLFILNIVMAIAVLYFILEVLINISSSSNFVRFFKIIPAFAAVMFVITSKKDILNNPEKFQSQEEEE